MEKPLPGRQAGDSSPPSIAHRLQSAAASLLSLFPFPFSPNPALRPNPNPNHHLSPSPHEPSTSSVLVPFHCSSFRSRPGKGTSSPISSAFGGLSTGVRVDGIRSGGDAGGGGPAFVGQVFTMSDPSGTRLVAVTTRFDVPFLTKRIPDWIKHTFKFIKHDNPGPVFRFFLDLNDAVTYLKHLKIPTGMVGACRLDVAYGHFKENPHMFQFVPNKKQVKAANELLKANKRSGREKLDGVPVFTAQNLNIAIATKNGIKWYTPYFFDKNLLDSILEDSVDQHFHTLIRVRHGQRHSDNSDIIEDSYGADMAEEISDNFFEPPEVLDVLEEIGMPGIPWGVATKGAEIALLDVVDEVILGNKWLRKVTGIQPKFPYLVDTFEARSMASLSSAKMSTSSSYNTDDNIHNHESLRECKPGDQVVVHKESKGFGIPFWEWFPNPWLKPQGVPECNDPVKRLQPVDDDGMHQQLVNPLLPKITMIGISTGEGGKVTKARLIKTMDSLNRELEQNSKRPQELNDHKDPLFVANVGDYSTITSMATF